ncbi:MAG: hypothetical protein AB7I04_18135 [Pseudomonadales bacterium]
MRSLMIVLVLALAAPVRAAEGDASAEGGAKTLSGMSVLGNNEAPKSLVLVPWKSSQIGDGIGVVESLSNRPMPVDRDVFGRELDYYRIRTDMPESTDSDADGFSVGTR